MSQGYAVGNALTGLAVGSFFWSTGYTTNRDRLNDGVMDSLAASNGSAATSLKLWFDMGAATALVGIALLNHNLNTGASMLIAIDAADDGAFSTNLVTVKAPSQIASVLAPNQKDTVLQFPSVTRRWWRLTFAYSGSITITIGELQALSSITALSRTAAYGAGETERYVLNRNESRTGNIRSTFLAGPLRTKSLPFVDLVGTSQRDELMTMWRATKGGNANLLWIEFIESTATAATAAAQECLWGKLEPLMSWTQPDFNLYTPGGLTVTGLGREVGS